VSISDIDHAIATAEREFERLNSGRHEQGFWLELPPDSEKRIIELAETMARLRRFEAWLRVKQMLENKQFMDGLRKLP